MLENISFPFLRTTERQTKRHSSGKRFFIPIALVNVRAHTAVYYYTNWLNTTTTILTICRIKNPSSRPSAEFHNIYDDDVIAAIRYPYTQHHIAARGEDWVYGGIDGGHSMAFFLFAFSIATFIVNKKNLPTGPTPRAATHTIDRDRWPAVRMTRHPLCKLYISCEPKKGQTIKNDGIVNRFELAGSTLSISWRSKRGRTADWLKSLLKTYLMNLFF